MADIDPITREALKRASHMRSRPQKQPTEQAAPAAPEPAAKPSPKPRDAVISGGLDALFKDKETSVILMLIILLMGEKGSESLLLALIYLLT